VRAKAVSWAIFCRYVTKVERAQLKAMAWDRSGRRRAGLSVIRQSNRRRAFSQKKTGVGSRKDGLVVGSVFPGMGPPTRAHGGDGSVPRPSCASQYWEAPSGHSQNQWANLQELQRAGGGTAVSHNCPFLLT
jgi:hypothetical protein